MAHTRNEAPKELIAALLSIAGLIAIFLGVAISSLFILKYYYPVSADEITKNFSQGKCQEGQVEVAINNYPGREEILKLPGNSEYKTGEVLKPLGGLFKCSTICVEAEAGKEQEKTVGFLSGGSIGGKPIVVVNNGTEFMQKFLEWQKEPSVAKQQFLAEDLKRTIIENQTKPSCVGPNSEDYGEIITQGGQNIPVTEKNTTATENDGKLPEPKKQSTDSAPEQPAISAPKKLTLPVGKTETKPTDTGAEKICVKRPLDNKYYWYTKVKDPDFGNEGYKWIATVPGGKSQINNNTIQTWQKSSNPNRDCATKKKTEDPTKAKLEQCKRWIYDFLAAHPNSSDPEIRKINSEFYKIKFPRSTVSSAKTQLSTCQVIYRKVVSYQALEAERKLSSPKPTSNTSVTQTVPQPTIESVYTSFGRIKATTSNPNGRASLIIDRKQNRIYWSMHTRVNGRTYRIIADAPIKNQRIQKNSRLNWQNDPGLGNVDSVLSKDKDPYYISDRDYQRFLTL